MRFFTGSKAKQERWVKSPTMSASSSDKKAYKDSVREPDDKTIPFWEWPDMSGVTRMVVEGISCATGKGVGKLASSAVASALTSGAGSAAYSTMAGRAVMGAAKGALSEIPGGSLAMGLFSGQGGDKGSNLLREALDREEALGRSRNNWRFSFFVLAGIVAAYAFLSLVAGNRSRKE